MNKILPGIMFAVVAANAGAVPVTIDSDNYAIGTNLSSVSSDFKMDVIRRETRDGPLQTWDVVVGEAPQEHPELIGEGFNIEGFGDNLFGYQQSNGLPGKIYYGVHLYDQTIMNNGVPVTMQNPVIGMRVQFFEPVRYLSFTTLTFADTPYIRAYDTQGNLVNAAWGELNRDRNCLCGVGQTTIQRDQADISYVVVGGSGSGTRINEFTYDVPAPSSLALLLLGAVGGVASRIRKSKEK